MKQKISFLINKLGIDGAILFTSFSRIIQTLGGFVSVFLIGTFLTREEQGFYYTFSSVLATQVFFELGLGGIIIQYVAHEMSNIEIKKDFQIEGNNSNISRLSSILHFSLKWYSILAVFLFITLQIAGYYYFSKFGKNYIEVDWKLTWFFVVLGSSLNLLISPCMAVMQGMNKVKEMAKFTLKQQLIVMFVSWAGLLLGAGIYVSAINTIVGFISLIIIYIRSGYPKLLINIYQIKITNKINYLNEILPLQWKIALSWMSGYFIFQFFNPIIFAFKGAKEAGKMGMTLIMLNAMLTFIVSWTSTKVPIWSNLIANHNYIGLNKSYEEVLKKSTLVTFIIIFLAFIFLASLNIFNFRLSDRFLPFEVCGLLFLTIPINNILNIWATYLRCFKKEPFMIHALTIGPISGLTTYFMAKYFGINQVVYGYFVVVYFISLPLGFFIFKNKKI